MRLINKLPHNQLLDVCWTVTDEQSSNTTHAVDNTAYSSASAYSIFVHADHRGGWTQIFGSKSSEPVTSQPVKNAIFTSPPAFGAPFGVILSNFTDIFRVIKLVSFAYCSALFLRC